MSEQIPSWSKIVEQDAAVRSAIRDAASPKPLSFPADDARHIDDLVIDVVDRFIDWMKAVRLPDKQAALEKLAARSLGMSLRYRGHQKPQDEPETTLD